VRLVVHNDDYKNLAPTHTLAASDREAVRFTFVRTSLTTVSDFRRGGDTEAGAG
jgi:hypothetical protein